MGRIVELRWVALMVVGVLALGLGAPWLVREMRTLPSATALAARADQKVVTLEVGGMTCSGCASAVQSKLTALPGVANAAVRYRQNRAYVVCDRSVADSALVQAVHRAGPGFLAVVAPR